MKIVLEATITSDSGMTGERLQVQRMVTQSEVDHIPDEMILGTAFSQLWEQSLTTYRQVAFGQRIIASHERGELGRDGA